MIQKLPNILLAAAIALAPLAVNAQSPGHLTLAKNLAARVTPTGYRIAGDLQSTNGCMKTRFVPVRSIYPMFDAQEYRAAPPNVFCTMIVTWKHTMLPVTTPHAPKSVQIRTKAGTLTIPVK